jgi:hypothetical protein
MNSWLRVCVECVGGEGACVWRGRMCVWGVRALDRMCYGRTFNIRRQIHDRAYQVLYQSWVIMTDNHFLGMSSFALVGDLDIR